MSEKQKSKRVIYSQSRQAGVKSPQDTTKQSFFPYLMHRHVAARTHCRRAEGLGREPLADRQLHVHYRLAMARCEQCTAITGRLSPRSTRFRGSYSPVNWRCLVNTPMGSWNVPAGFLTYTWRSAQQVAHRMAVKLSDWMEYMITRGCGKCSGDLGRGLGAKRSSCYG
jgi:hypothetical protein